MAADSGEKIRAFLALPLPQVFREEISDYLDRIQSRVQGIKWVKPEQVHVTLHFFGSVTPGDIEKVKKIVSPVTAEFAPLALVLE